MYYAETPDAAHDIHDLKVNLLGESFQFYTDAGVFSKKMIDFGSQVLLSALDLEADLMFFLVTYSSTSESFKLGV